VENNKWVAEDIAVHDAYSFVFGVVGAISVSGVSFWKTNIKFGNFNVVFLCQKLQSSLSLFVKNKLDYCDFEVTSCRRLRFHQAVLGSVLKRSIAGLL